MDEPQLTADTLEDRPEPDRTLVHARYLGDSEVLMPDLARRERCCQAGNLHEEETNAWLRGDPENGVPPEHGVNPHVLLRKGDVILLDRYSAQGREDFEILEPEAPGPESRQPEPEPAAPARGRRRQPEPTEES